MKLYVPLLRSYLYHTFAYLINYYMPFTAIIGSDYRRHPHFFVESRSSNNTRDCLTIDIIDDNVIEGNQTFIVSLNEGDMVRIGHHTRTTIIIIDNGK